MAALTTTAKAQAGDASPIGQIDTECNAIQNAVMALYPIHVAYQSGTWVVLSDADFAVAEKVGASIMLADVYKQGSNYAWVAAHSFDASGKQRATQLCFRQSDGTLERARQATTVPDLGAVSAQQAYFASDGTLIQKTALFEENDPQLAKKIEALPFYSVLPQ
ncbi:MAG: hypothetical protein WCC84_09790 [Candidatus Cybelea sp.]